MPRFTEHELLQIAEWDPIAPGLGRHQETINTQVGPILDRLMADERLHVSVFRDGGTSNYFAFVVCPAADRPVGADVRNVSCTVVQLSLLAPIAVFGTSTFSAGENFFAISNLELDQVRDPDSASDWVGATVVAAVHESSAYRLLRRETVAQPLPPGAKIHEYCQCAEPWDRAFHALFADTD